jgi:hypothetical protein
MIIMRGVVKEARECWELRAGCQLSDRGRGEIEADVEGADDQCRVKAAVLVGDGGKEAFIICKLLVYYL